MFEAVIKWCSDKSTFHLISIFIEVMTTQTIMILIIIGLMAGALSGFVGVGGGVVIVPALIYTLGMGQFNAQGTSLFILLLPVGIMAFYNYAKHDHVNWKFGIIVAFGLGGDLLWMWGFENIFCLKGSMMCILWFGRIIL